MACSVDASAGEGLPCDKSRIAYDSRADPEEAEFSCSRGEISAVASDPKMIKLQKEHPDTWALTAAFAQAFSPENTIVDQADMGGGTGKYATTYLAVAKPGRALSQPDLRKAVEASVGFNLFSDEPMQD